MQGRRSLFVGVAYFLVGLARGAGAQSAAPVEPAAPAAPVEPAAVEAMPPVEPPPAPPPQPESPQAVPAVAAPPPPPAPLMTPTPPVRAGVAPETSPAPRGSAGPGDGGGAAAEAPVSRGAVALELGAGAAAAARFPDARGRSSEEALDGVFSLGAFAGSHRLSLGLVVERMGLGKDHYAANAAGETLNASYLVDTLWVAGRLHLTPERPSVYLGVAIGPALPRLRGTGTRASANAFSTPPEPFQCSDAGRLGAGLALAAGVEADVASAWSLLGEARATGHLLSAAGDGHGTCGPGGGPALGGALRIGVAYRFGS